MLIISAMIMDIMPHRLGHLMTTIVVFMILLVIFMIMIFLVIFMIMIFLVTFLTRKSTGGAHNKRLLQPPPWFCPSNGLCSSHVCCAWDRAQGEMSTLLLSLSQNFLKKSDQTWDLWRRKKQVTLPFPF